MKTGLHNNGEGGAQGREKILDYYRRTGALTFKTLTFDQELLRQLKAMGVTTIGRVHFDDQPLGGAGAKQNLKRILDAAGRNQYVDFWEGYNEAYQGPRQNQPASEARDEETAMSRYAEFEIERVGELARLGRRAIVGNFSCGTPDLDTRAWEIFKPALVAAFAAGGGLGLHEYAGPYMQYMLETPGGSNQWVNNRFTGASANGIWDPNVEGWLCLRYRKVWEKFLAPWGLGKIPIFITEGGIDDTTPRPGPASGKGWKTFQDGVWNTIPGIGDYAEQRKWYMVQVTHDDGNGRPLVGGVVDFGWDGTKTGWVEFDLANAPAMLERIIAAESALPVARGPLPGPTPPRPTPPPIVVPPVAPPPPPPPVVVAPAPRGVEPRIEVEPGMGWYAVARALLGRNATAGEVVALQAANPTVAGLRAGQWLLSPWHRVATK